MKWSLFCTIVLAAIGLSLVTAAPPSSKTADAPQKFNLADLANGETRTFGEGDHAITATRRGDDIEVTFTADDGKSRNQTLHCTVGKDSCYAYAVSEGGEGHVVVLSKTGASAGKDGEKELTKVVLADGTPDARQLMVFAADDEDGSQVVIKGDGEGMTWITTDVETAEVAGGGTAAHPGMKVIKVVAEGGSVLRCPEGDATLTLKKGEEKTGPYFCPRHNLKMELSKEPIVIKKHVKVETDPESKGEY